jgi:hypothetical protein
VNYIYHNFFGFSQNILAYVFHTHYHLLSTHWILDKDLVSTVAVALALVVLAKSLPYFVYQWNKISWVCISNLWEQYGFVCPQIPAEKYS